MGRHLDPTLSTDELARLYRSGLTVEEVSRRVGRDRHTVEYRLRRGGIGRRSRGFRRRVYGGSERALVAAYQKNILPVKQIAEAFGVSVWGVYLILRRNGIKPNRTGRGKRRRKC